MIALTVTVLIILIEATLSTAVIKMKTTLRKAETNYAGKKKILNKK